MPSYRRRDRRGQSKQYLAVLPGDLETAVSWVQDEVSMSAEREVSSLVEDEACEWEDPAVGNLLRALDLERFLLQQFEDSTGSMDIP